MIINIRGTSGSGKTTLVNRIREMYSHHEPVFIPGRKRPVRYKLSNPPDLTSTLTLIGSYENACGGCDTMPGYEAVFEHVRIGLTETAHVMFEGLLITPEVNRTISQHYESGGVVVIHLNTPIEECLASVNKRRHARDETLPPVNPKNTESMHGRARRAVDLLTKAGITTYSLDRDAALAKVAELLFPGIA